MRLIMTLIVLCCFCPPLAAEEPAKKVVERPIPARTLTLTPQRIKSPALRYPLLPPFLERTDGNAATLYYRSLVSLYDIVILEQDAKEWEDVHQWLETPPDKLPRDEVRKMLARFNHVLENADLGARRNDCDWDLPIPEKKEELFAILLPEIQNMRQIARLLKVKARLEIAEGQYTQALHTLQTGYAIAQHIAEPPFLICDLVGVAYISMMNEELFAFISSPGAPNLYWSLTALPRPIIDFHAAFELEANSFYFVFPQLLAAKTKTLTSEQWGVELEQFLDKFEKTIPAAAANVQAAEDIKKRLTRAEILARAVEAKAGLIKLGHPPDAAKSMSNAQAILLYTALIFDHFRDDLFKWSYVPYIQAREEFPKARQRLKEQSEEVEIVPVAALLLPAIDVAASSVARRQRQIDLIRVIEALRMYAAEHDNKFPASLAEIKDVPIPDNPMTGKPFSYQLIGEDALLETLTLKIAKSAEE